MLLLFSSRQSKLLDRLHEDHSNFTGWSVHNWYHYLIVKFPGQIYIAVFFLFLRDGDVMLSRSFDRQTPLESVPPMILILITSDPSLVHTLTRILVWLTLKYKYLSHLTKSFSWVSVHRIGMTNAIAQVRDGTLCLILSKTEALIKCNWHNFIESSKSVLRTWLFIPQLVAL